MAAYYADQLNQRRQTESEYLGWIRSFYQGSLVAPTGWLQVQDMVVSSARAPEQARVAARLGQLGALIAAEWAKDNANRAIDSRMLALWASVLQLAADPVTRGRAIELIASDVDSLLQGDMAGTQIRDARYENMLDMELFSGF